MRYFLRYALHGLAVFLILVLNTNIAWGVGVLTTPRDYLNRQISAQTTGIQHEVFFTTDSAVSGGVGANKVVLTFPDGDNWCGTTGSDLVVTGITDPTGAAGTESATALPTSTTLAGACTQAANDLITITVVDDLSASTKYGVRIADGSTAKLGTAAAGNNIQVTVTTNNGTIDIDSANLALSLISNDQVVVSATVNPSLTVVVTPNTVNLGILTTASVFQDSVTSTVTTNAQFGFISLVKYGATLTSGGFTIPAETGGGTITEGTSEYGASTNDTTATDLPDTTSSCVDSTGPENAAALTTTFQSFASESASVSSDVTTLCFVAAISGTQQAGTYTSTATLVTTAKF